MADFGELLIDYGARTGTLRRGGRSVTLDGPGGGLVAAAEQLGLTPLAAALAEGDRVSLADDGVTVTLNRVEGAVLLRVEWVGGATLSETLAVPPSGAVLTFPDAEDAPGGRFLPDPAAQVVDLRAALHDPGLTLFVTSSGVWTRGRWGEGEPLLATIPALSPGDLGDPTFCEDHGVVAPYIAGAMAGGIASAELVIAMSRAGMLGFFGAGGLGLEAIERAVIQIQEAVAGGPAGFNLLHNPNEPAVEEATVDIYLRHGCRAVSASAYMTLTPAVVRYRLAGIRQTADGRIRCPNRVLAKVSRPDVAERFMRPAPEKMLKDLVASGALTPEEAALGRRVPVAEDITAEADSGGHTDHRPLVTLLPTLLRLAAQVSAEEGYAEQGVRLRVGAAGGIADPASASAAFCMGAAYILTGSINQATVEAGTSPLVKQMVAEATMLDVTTGPAPDMFEQGAHVQVLSRGTLYAQRAGRLHKLYRDYPSLEAIPAEERSRIERTILRRDLAAIWADTEAYWQGRDPRELARAARDPRHKMALTFRWYLGMTSRWARLGEVDRKLDFQIWCGPAIGLFNAWVQGSWLEPLPARRVVDIAHAILDGVAAAQRVQLARTLLMGKVVLPDNLNHPPPRSRSLHP